MAILTLFAMTNGPMLMLWPGHTFAINESIVISQVILVQIKSTIGMFLDDVECLDFYEVTCENPVS